MSPINSSMGGFHMKEALVKSVAVAGLFLLGAAAMAAQAPVAVRRPVPEAREVKSAPAPRARSRKQAASEWNRSVDYSGPRFGFTYLPAAIVDSLKNHDIEV